MHTTVDSSLFASWEIIQNVSKFTDLFLADLKLIDSASHQHYTGVPNELILENIKKLSDSGASIIIRIPMIPEVTTSAENIAQTISYLKSLNGKIREVNLLPFHNTANGKYIRFGMKNQFDALKSLNKEELKDIENQFINAGFLVKTGG